MANLGGSRMGNSLIFQLVLLLFGNQPKSLRQWTVREMVSGDTIARMIR